MPTADLPTACRRTNRPEKTPNWLTPGLRSGSDEVWGHFNFLHGGWIYSLARRWGLAREDARDMVQEVMMDVYRSLHLFRRDRAAPTFQGWVYCIARNHVVDHIERTRRVPTVPLARPLDTFPDPVTQSDGLTLPDEERLRLRARVEELAAVHFRSDSWGVFVAVELEGMSAAELSRQRGLNHDAVRKQVSRVKSWLRTLQATDLFFDPLRTPPAPGGPAS